MKCENCCFANEADALFCERCGKKVVDDKPEYSFNRLKETVSTFTDKEKKLLIAVLVLIIATPIICAIVKKADAFAEKKAYEKEQLSVSEQAKYQNPYYY